jgi:hypothetical protein
MIKKLLALTILCSVTYPQDPNYSNRLLFIEGYERIKPNDVYGALIGWISPNYLSQSDAWIFEIEGRIGYTASFQQKTTLIPYLCFGYLNDIKRSHKHIRTYLRHMKEHTLEYGYGGYGLMIKHSFNDLFGLGLNLKGMIGKGTIGSFCHNNKWANGLDTGLPFTICFGYKRRFDFVVEPFYIFLKSQHDESSYLGTRLSLGLKF